METLTEGMGFHAEFVCQYAFIETVLGPTFLQSLSYYKSYSLYSINLSPYFILNIDPIHIYVYKYMFIYLIIYFNSSGFF
jgi:hypothetical protein